MRHFSSAILSFVCALMISSACTAETLPLPKGEPVLVVSGNISNTNVSGTAQFDLSMLEAIGMVTMSTKTPWYDGTVTFEGVPMEKLMKVVGAKGKNVRAIALNDYAINIPVDDFVKFGTMLAIKRDGQYMPVRDKGPLFIVYPFDSNRELRTQTYYGRSAWQLSKLVVE